MKKFCTKCGKPFDAVGREVICPVCKAAAAEESKRAAVLRAKRASWAGESVPVRISGRASTLIRKYGEVNSLSFAESLDTLLKASTFFQSAGKAWEDITPYKSHRRDKHATESTSTTENKQDAPQDKPQATDKQDKPIKQAAKVASKTNTAKTSKTSKTSKGEKKA